MTDPILQVRQDGPVLTLLMNRPHKRNALSGALVQALLDAFREASEMETVRVVLLRGAGPDFCAGADLAEMEAMLEEDEATSLADARRLGDLLLAMRNHPTPIVGVVQGRALAGGCGLATACDLVLASEEAELGYPEVHLGFVPAMVMAILRRKLPEGRAFELVATGARISAVEARGLGLVNQVFPADVFEEEVDRFASRLAEKPPSALRLTKALLYEQADLTVAEGIERGAQVNVEARRTPACREGVKAFLSGKRGGSR